MASPISEIRITHLITLTPPIPGMQGRRVRIVKGSLLLLVPFILGILGAWVAFWAIGAALVHLWLLILWDKRSLPHTAHS